jgi:carbamoyl-phosphate synthase large subunit
MACVGTQLMLGAKLKHLNLQRKRVLHAAVKEVVLRFNMFSGTGSSAGCPDALAGRGVGVSADVWPGLLQSPGGCRQAAHPGAGFLSVSDRDKPQLLDVARKFAELGFRIKATAGTYQFLRQHEVRCKRSFKLHQDERPNVLDEIKSSDIHLIIDIPSLVKRAGSTTLISARPPSNTKSRM